MKKVLPQLPATGLTPVAQAIATSAAVSDWAQASATTSPSPAAKKRGRPSKARPYQIEGRNGWWANRTLPNGTRPLRKFETEEAAAAWIAEQLESARQALQPALGGPENATVGQLLFKYAYRATVLKGGAEAELTRINNYLTGSDCRPCAWSSMPRADASWSKQPRSRRSATSAAGSSTSTRDASCVSRPTRSSTASVG